MIHMWLHAFHVLVQAKKLILFVLFANKRILLSGKNYIAMLNVFTNPNTKNENERRKVMDTVKCNVSIE